MTFTPYEDKAQEMFELAMENVKSDVDKAWNYAEELAVLVGKINDEELRDKLDEHISMVMLYLEKI